MTSLTRRRLMAFVGGVFGSSAAGVGLGAGVRGDTPRQEAIRDYRRAVSAFVLTGPHGRCADILLHLVAPRFLERRLLRAKLHGAPADADRFWELIGSVRTERYLDDKSYAHRVHRDLRRLCGGVRS